MSVDGLSDKLIIKLADPPTNAKRHTLVTQRNKGAFEEFQKNGIPAEVSKDVLEGALVVAIENERYDTAIKIRDAIRQKNNDTK